MNNIKIDVTLTFFNYTTNKTGNFPFCRQNYDFDEQVKLFTCYFNCF